jgi:endonuclease/exonuclease/phosphatase family metal-dependent hydrolase
MTARPIARRLRLRMTLPALLAALLLILTGAATAAPPPQANLERVVSVMTRNLYLGATLTPLFPDPPLDSGPAVVAAATQVWHQVAATDFPRRAEALADEIVTAQPDLVGLQEVTLYRVGDAGDPDAAEQVRLDFLEVLQAELRSRGQRYDVAVSQPAFDGEVTAFDWPTGLGGTGGLIDLRLTDRDVILVRRSPATANMKVSNPQGGIYAAALPLEILGQPLPIVRGWTAVDVKLRGREFRFVNTHLEAFHAGFAALQAMELVSTGPAATALPIVLTGDFNAAPGESAYAVIAAAGLTDVAVGGAPTCCFEPDLASGSLSTRIDLVFTRGPITTTSVDIVGVDQIATQPPLWASDHAGVVAEVVLDPK